MYDAILGNSSDEASSMIDLSIIELEEITTPDVSSFLAGMGTAFAFGGLLLAAT
ncbi:hypothetical protein [Amycolatopsis sp. cmx-11-12]|uniref:hypothetical protein n=1 Tax=Amycolatopsis sp. cmx-11-12 TaxID=2785795 RepID=UPI003917BDCE